jgi:hypothetical protein
MPITLADGRVVNLRDVSYYTAAQIAAYRAEGRDVRIFSPLDDDYAPTARAMVAAERRKRKAQRWGARWQFGRGRRSRRVTRPNPVGVWPEGARKWLGKRHDAHGQHKILASVEVTS